jgi:hypothetical protein
MCVCGGVMMLDRTDNRIAATTVSPSKAQGTFICEE